MEGVWILNKFLQTQTTSQGIENPEKFPCLRNHRAERAFCLVSFVFNFSALLFIAKFTCQLGEAATDKNIVLDNYLPFYTLPLPDFCFCTVA